MGQLAVLELSSGATFLGPGSIARRSSKSGKGGVGDSWQSLQVDEDHQPMAVMLETDPTAREMRPAVDAAEEHCGPS